MKKLLFFVAVCLILASASGWAGQGEDVFKSQGCGVCHKPETGKLNPSLKEIAHAYQGKEDHLINFLKGEGESIVKPEMASMMKRYVEKTKGLSDDDLKALSDFILSHKN